MPTPAGLSPIINNQAATLQSQIGLAIGLNGGTQVIGGSEFIGSAAGARIMTPASPTIPTQLSAPVLANQRIGYRQSTEANPGTWYPVVNGPAIANSDGAPGDVITATPAPTTDIGSSGSLGIFVSEVTITATPHVFENTHGEALFVSIDCDNPVKVRAVDPSQGFDQIVIDQPVGATAPQLGYFLNPGARIEVQAVAGNINATVNSLGLGGAGLLSGLLGQDVHWAFLELWNSDATEQVIDVGAGNRSIAMIVLSSLVPQNPALATVTSAVEGQPLGVSDSDILSNVTLIDEFKSDTFSLVASPAQELTFTRTTAGGTAADNALKKVHFQVLSYRAATI